jgi:hypothetical protein
VGGIKFLNSGNRKKIYNCSREREECFSFSIGIQFAGASVNVVPTIEQTQNT